MSEISIPPNAAAIPPKNLPKFISIAELAKATTLSRQTISRRIKDGDIPFDKSGIRVTIPLFYLIKLENKAWSSVKKIEAAAVLPRGKIPQFITIAELAKATTLSRQTISRRKTDCEIPYIKLGGRILIPISYLTNQETEAWSKLRQGSLNA